MQAKTFLAVGSLLQAGIERVTLRIQAAIALSGARSVLSKRGGMRTQRLPVLSGKRDAGVRSLRCAQTTQEV
jgi:hypothetical protein